jgi:hypothetical protein
MVSIGISEFSFGFAFLHEQVNLHPSVRAAPVLPSLRQEKDLSYDAHLPLIGTDFYYQFKLSQYMKGARAQYRSEDPWYHGPYHKIDLYRRDANRQHNNLVHYAASHPHTYYVAPEFADANQFNTAFRSRRIRFQSRLIPLQSCHPYTDDEQHHITFQANSRLWTQHSEPVVNEDSIPGERLEALYLESRERWVPIDEAFALRLFKTTQLRVAELERREGQLSFGDALSAGEDADEPGLEGEAEARGKVEETGREHYLRRTSELLALAFGLTLVIVGAPA